MQFKKKKKKKLLSLFLFFLPWQMVFSFVSKNPVLRNITDYLVEEGSYEEEELLGNCNFNP